MWFTPILKLTDLGFIRLGVIDELICWLKRLVMLCECHGLWYDPTLLDVRDIEVLCILTSQRVLRMPFAGWNHFFDPKTTFSGNFYDKMFKKSKKVFICSRLLGYGPSVQVKGSLPQLVRPQSTESKVEDTHKKKLKPLNAHQQSVCFQIKTSPSRFAFLLPLNLKGKEWFFPSPVPTKGTNFLDWTNPVLVPVMPGSKIVRLSVCWVHNCII